MKKIVFSHAIHEEAMKRLGAKFSTKIEDNSDTESFLGDMKDAEGLVLRMGRVTREMIEQCPKLEVMARPGVGVDIFDVEAATEHGIPIVICPGANTRSVAEHAMALLYAISKNIVESHFEVKNGNYFIRNKGVTVDLLGKRAGIIGFGAIGRQTAKLMHNNGLQISAYDPYAKREDVEALGYKYEASLDALLGSVDVISLHLPSLPETRGMIGVKQFAVMTKGMFIVNCARGDIIVEEALYDAMIAGVVAGAGVDVMVNEPMNPKSPLFMLPNFVATPHSAALTKESHSAMGQMLADGVIAILAGERWPTVTNPDAYKHPRWNR